MEPYWQSEMIGRIKMFKNFLLLDRTETKRQDSSWRDGKFSPFPAQVEWVDSSSGKEISKLKFRNETPKKFSAEKDKEEEEAKLDSTYYENCRKNMRKRDQKNYFIFNIVKDF